MSSASCGARVCSVDFTHGPHRHEQGVVILDREMKARIDADNKRIRNELRDRLDRLDDPHIDAALRWLANEVPDAVNDALNETEA